MQSCVILNLSFQCLNKVYFYYFITKQEFKMKLQNVEEIKHIENKLETINAKLIIKVKSSLVAKLSFNIEESVQKR